MIKANHGNDATYDDTEIQNEIAEISADITNINQKINDLKQIVVAPNAGAHNAIYRGKDITSKFYDGTLSQQIAAGTFDDIFIGDYIIGQTSGRKYLVADINYRLHTGDTECITPHILMIPERTMGNAQMNNTNITTGAYKESKMYTNNLTPYINVIKNDFGANHIVQHKNFIANATINDCESAGIWIESEIELMNELMVYGSNMYHNIMNGNSIPANITIDKSQLSLFQLDKSKIVACDDSGERYQYWLRDVVSSSDFAYVHHYGNADHHNASFVKGVRPAFLIK